MEEVEASRPSRIQSALWMWSTELRAPPWAGTLAPTPQEEEAEKLSCERAQRHSKKETQCRYYEAVTEKTANTEEQKKNDIAPYANVRTRKAVSPSKVECLDCHQYKSMFLRSHTAAHRAIDRGACMWLPTYHSSNHVKSNSHVGPRPRPICHEPRQFNDSEANSVRVGARCSPACPLWC